MTQADYTKLIKRFAAGKLDQQALHEGIGRLIASNPDLQLAELLASTQVLLKKGQITPKFFRKVSEFITELNIQQAMSQQSQNHCSTSAEETFIMPNPPTAENIEETLIIPDQPTSPTTDQNLKNTAKPGKNPQDVQPIRIKEGDILKDRFELMELLGRGGMGVVYKARDLVKVKARDNNPYVAIKVLSEAFKKHSRSFIALQREASKSQRLAHPNIATVYDFDHDGDAIYMTMELLDGQPFDILINQLPPGGLPQKAALQYIQDLCHGLAYAHKQNLIHCDLKPANIYLCANGTVKLLDFGITRAIKNEQHESGEDTLFDPATLKALTPAYASVEMFRGAPPDPRDDIYALACVSHELLTGIHPYKKVAAHKALELGLKPQTVKGLSRNQQRALYSALELERNKRTATVENFLAGLQKPNSHAKQLAFVGTFLVLLCGALLIKPIQTHLREEAKLEMVQSIKAGDQEKLVTLLNSINQLDSETQEYYTFRLRKEIILYFEKRINAVKNADLQRYNYPEAIRLLNEVKQLYTDSALLKEAEIKLLANKQNLVSILVSNYKKLSSQNKNTRRILEILKEAEPNHPLLRGEAH